MAALGWAFWTNSLGAQVLTFVENEWGDKQILAAQVLLGHTVCAGTEAELDVRRLKEPLFCACCGRGPSWLRMCIMQAGPF